MISPLGTRRGVIAFSLMLAAQVLVDRLPSSALALDAKAADNSLVCKAQGQTIKIQPWGRDSFRVRITPAGGGQTSDWALDIPPAEHRAQITINKDVAEIRNGLISARIRNTPVQSAYMEFFRHKGNEKVPILSEYDYGVWAHNPGTRTFKPVQSGLFHSELHFAARNGERFYGMRENATGRVNLKGCVIDLYQRHVKAVVPFVVSSEGYGFLWNNPSLGRAEFGNDRTRWVSYGSRQLNYFITAGNSYADMP